METYNNICLTIIDNELERYRCVRERFKDCTRGTEGFEHLFNTIQRIDALQTVRRKMEDSLAEHYEEEKEG